MSRIGLLLALLLLAGCTTSPPKNTANVCEIFREKDDWYEAASDARKEWGSPIAVMMAIMHQESRFVATARPPRRKILWIFPGPRPSDAYGYSQAKDDTWEWYQRDTGQWTADRDDFEDAIDFIGWYNQRSVQHCAIKPDDTYHLYLAYHEGHGGFNRRSFSNKSSLKAVASKVSAQAGQYRSQLLACEEQLKDKGWFFGLF